MVNGQAATASSPTGTFSLDVKEDASRDGAPVELINGDGLCGLLKDFLLESKRGIRPLEDIQLDLDFFNQI
jgi:hypothetical protein